MPFTIGGGLHSSLWTLFFFFFWIMQLLPQCGIGSDEVRKFFQERLSHIYILNPKNNTHILYLFIAYTWNVCNFDLTYDIFICKQNIYVKSVFIYFQKK